MKQLLSFLILLPLGSLAQHSLSGSVLDAESRPVPFSDAILLQRDSLPYKNVQADELGNFGLNGILKGAYILKISSVGFSDKFQDIKMESDLTLQPIILEASSKTLESVEIVSRRPIVKRLIDRTEFSIENSSLASNNAWEILGKTPGVTASAAGVLNVRGSQSILVTINDKKVYLSGDELKQFLENTSGEDVKSIEVITNPPAKYDAQGSTVINIKMKKVLVLGYKGNANIAYVQSIYPKGVISSGHFYKSRKLALTGRYTFGSGVYVSESKDVSRYFDENGAVSSEWKSDMRRKNKSLAQHSYRLQASYELDSLNTFSFGTTGFQAPKQQGSYNVPTWIYGGEGQLDSLYVTSNDRKYPVRNMSYNFLYEKIISDKEKLSVAADYTSYRSTDYQDIKTVFSLPESVPYRQARFINDNQQAINLLTAQADYSNENIGLEAGLKFGQVGADNNLDFKDDIGGEIVQNSNRSSLFLYDESIFAGYASYAKEIGKWSLKAGLRGEYTKLEGNAVASSEASIQKYFKLFPTLYVLYKPGEGNEIGISYGKRISRPQYRYLNPFRIYLNNYAYFIGDPKLLPTVTHNVNLLYTLKGKYNFDLFYRLEKNPSMEISYLDYDTNTVVNNFTNIEKDFAFGLEFNANLTFYGWWEAGLQAGLSYVEDLFQGVDGGLYKNGRPTYNGSINNRLALNKKKDFNGEVNFEYNSSSVQGNFVFTATTNLSVALRKKVMKEKGEVYLLISDIYRGEKQTVTTDYANQYNSYRSYDDSQSFRLGFRYNFGNQKLENKAKEVQTEEQKRL
ncbi:MAG TPA: outer membrane beta-barrel family protein [Flavobacterium sp.]|nr:outer membrane beta-barrel family protein [Flavobacterium sp.]